jgi:hypothetical protein
VRQGRTIWFDSRNEQFVSAWKEYRRIPDRRRRVSEAGDFPVRVFVFATQVYACGNSGVIRRTPPSRDTTPSRKGAKALGFFGTAGLTRFPENRSAITVRAAKFLRTVHSSRCGVVSSVPQNTLWAELSWIPRESVAKWRVWPVSRPPPDRYFALLADVGFGGQNQ